MGVAELASDPGTPRLALMVGLPRSGKTTYARALQAHGWTRISPDDFREALHGRRFHAPAEPTVWASAELAVRALLIGGHAVVVDATNVAKRRRAPWIAMARALGAPVEAFVLPTSGEECRRRNEAGGRPVPPEVIDRMAAQWEPVDGAGEEGVTVRTITDATRKEKREGILRGSA